MLVLEEKRTEQLSRRHLFHDIPRNVVLLSCRDNLARLTVNSVFVFY